MARKRSPKTLDKIMAASNKDLDQMTRSLAGPTDPKLKGRRWKPTEDIAQAKEEEGYTLYHVDQTDAELVERLHTCLGDWCRMFEALQSEGLLVRGKFDE